MIIIYTLPDCTHCNQTKEYLQERGLEYKEINMKKGGNPETIQMKKKFKKLGIDTVPVIVVGEDIVPGFDKDVLDELLR